MPAQVARRKSKGILKMSHHKVSPKKLQEIHDLAAGWGKIVSRRVFAGSGPGLEIDFRALEEVAATAARGLTEGTLGVLLEQQAQTLGKEQPCPVCGRLCPVGRAERPLAVQGGQLTLREPVCHCPDCRRDFFPPARLPASGQSRLQSRPVTEDHRGRRPVALRR
jgi:hypothetical protein